MTDVTPQDHPSVSVVVPVYNSAESLEMLVERIESVLAPRGPLEIILVDDGSTDGSSDRIADLSRRGSVRGLKLSRNFGQHNALLAGIRTARHAVVVTIDDDLQNPPEEIPKLLGALDGKTAVVYGAPIEEQHDRWRRLTSRMTKWALQEAVGAQTARKVSAFRAFETRLRDGFADYSGPFVSIDVLLTWATDRFGAVPVRHDLRHIGSSGYTARRLMTHALNMMTGFSTLPLQLASLIGFAFSLFGVAVLIYVVARTIANGGSVPGFPFLASVIAIFAGAQLFALGIIGEYLARMHFRLMQKPSYNVASVCGEPTAANGSEGETDGPDPRPEVAG